MMPIVTMKQEGYKSKVKVSYTPYHSTFPKKVKVPLSYGICQYRVYVL